MGEGAGVDVGARICEDVAVAAGIGTVVAVVGTVVAVASAISRTGLVVVIVGAVVTIGEGTGVVPAAVVSGEQATNAAAVATVSSSRILVG